MRFSLPPCGQPIGLVLSLLFSLMLVLTSPAPAQTAAPAPPPMPATDVILRLDGEEVAGRVLLITPTELRYLPAPVAGTPAGAATTPDTLRLPVAAVFLVRYANGTREVLTRPLVAAPLLGDGRLDTLSGPERQRLGRSDARRYYRGRSVFWGSAGAFWLGVPGLVGTAIVSSRPVPAPQLRAPLPVLLQDSDYGAAYQQQANRLKRGKAWAGYGTGAAILLGAVYLTLLSEQQ
ncbi:hypothetical protein [uncultured Hymenobacter sp.]|uniref:hypothetical protein n=1 Tax=uncultured Hymenobacter sp. TaxID=170016 RepID=UPI0035CBBC20